MTRLAQLIAREEGFGLSHVTPTLDHNPGDLRHSPHSQHPGGPAHANDVGTIDNDADGWADLERQLGIYAEMGFNLRQMVFTYLGVPKDATAAQVAAAPDHNNVAGYLGAICNGLGLPAETPVSVALKLLA